ncbi:MAG: sodium:dicarboxylate symporter [Deltaproteobacteria bacterium CG_4_10_14_0_2_um_filter_43_8]|nr:MAG: sodium:dicarboxylate symporter [Deltaproteobacteria bacterium CG11_big_fil_rev_8_21_14_0_20_42_23]PJA18859.1 MAG: sodium:dicarboxylate symporter [Deltaproteobacteria bacterium CG_4_10_14_0_2_um_filter_43_8]PJC65070.1 MAG: sodium:dicarboxylate symporter [Deltaproteobacteria bacterium CG_4_9_14_0_2_um_filter_42_21]
MKKFSDKLLIILIVIASLAGAFCGWFYGPKMLPISFLGTFFLNALKMMVVPLVMLSVISGVTSLGDVRKIGKLGFKTISYYFITTIVAVILGLVLVNIIEPGMGITVGEDIGAVVPKPIGITDIFLSFVHPSIVEAMSSSKILPIIIFSLLFGAMATTLGEKGKALISIIESLNQVIMKMVHVILWIAPIGIFALVAAKLGESGGGEAFFAELSKVGAYSATVLIGLFIHAALVLPLMLFFTTKRNPFRYLAGSAEALVTAFSTASSSATLPVTIQNVKENNKVSETSANFVLPLGSTINMDGTALYEAVAAMFIAQSYDIHLGVAAQAIIFFTAVLASVGAAGIPQAGLVTMVLVLTAVGLPLEGIGIILSVDWFLDRFRTVVNVWGDCVGAAVIDTLHFGKGKPFLSFPHGSRGNLLG